MKKLLLSTVLVLSSLCIFTQELSVIVPPSPESTSLAKFTEIPVSYYTGIPSINVPIHEINFDGLKIPVGLSYHARGVKVEEIASRVGIGWALNAGGAITRQIRDGDDFSSQGYVTENYLQNFETNLSVREDVFARARETDDKIDLIPDQFSFNFLDYSGKFIFDQGTKKAILQSYDDLTIDKIGSSGNNIYFVITNKDGFKFYFGNPEITNTTREAKDNDLSSIPYKLTSSVAIFPASKGMINTWHLVDIVSPNGKKIHFNYQLETPTFFRRSYDKHKKDEPPSSYFSQLIQNQYQLKEIVFNQGIVKFIRSTKKREDLKDGYALSSIEIENNHEVIKKYNFNHSYSYNSSSNNINHYLFYENEAKKRLFLDNIQVVDNNNKSELYRAFEYTNKNLMPNRFSNEQDLWGYYNGKNNGPFLTYYNYQNYSVSRQVDTVKARTGLIKKMLYPTGGYTSYTFEANKAIMPDYFKDLVYANPNPTVQTRYASLRKGTETRVSYGVYENAFTIRSSDVGPITVRVNFYGNVGDCSISSSNPNVGSNCKYRVSIIHENGQVVTMDNGIPLHLFSYSGNSSYMMPITILPVGNYRIKVENLLGVDDPNDFQNGFSVHLSWYEPSQPNTPTNLIYSGGNRIKKIENYSVDNGTITRTYEYLKADDNSSGLLFSLPSYYYKVGVTTLPSGIQVPVTDEYGARPGSPITYEQGNHVGYSHVTEYIDSEDLQGKGGKIAYEFTSMPDGGKFYEFPYTLSVNNEWLRGKPLSIESYKREPNLTYTIVKKEDFIYTYANGFSHGILSDPYNLRTDPVGGTSLSLNYIKNDFQYHRPLIVFKSDNLSSNIGPDNYKVYYLTGGVSSLSRKTETNYVVLGGITTQIKYNYDYGTHYQVAGSEMTNSKGELYKTSNTYNILSNPLRILPDKTTTYKGSRKLSEKHTVYANFGNLYLPSKVETSKGIQGLEERITYHDYDDKGNPIDVGKSGGSRVLYVWGYNKSYPIVKIEGIPTSYKSIDDKLKQLRGVNFTTLQRLSNEDTNLSTEQNLRNSYKSLYTVLKSLYPTAQLTTYTYDPLIGVTSITDPRQETIYYAYDDFNRLEYVKDSNKNILKEYKYNYKKQ